MEANVIDRRATAVQRAGAHIAAAYRVLLFAQLEQAVDAAYTPTGPSREELRERILAYRGLSIVEAEAS